YYAFDDLGSTIQLTDSTGLITDDYAYDAWGEVATSTGSTTNPMQYVGQLGYYRDDDISQTHVRRREYDTLLGRFFSEDPIRQDGGNNLYQYVTNDPINRTDPSGLKGITLRDGETVEIIDPMSLPSGGLLDSPEIDVEFEAEADLFATTPTSVSAIKSCNPSQSDSPANPTDQHRESLIAILRTANITIRATGDAANTDTTPNCTDVDLNDHQVVGDRVLPRFDNTLGYGFRPDGTYVYRDPLSGQLVEPCAVCHGGNQLGRLPGLTSTDSYVGGKWYHSGSNGNILGNYSAAFSAAFATPAVELVNFGKATIDHMTIRPTGSHLLSSLRFNRSVND
ncbi:MAG: repeat protein, partial [Schlesneria sp.]|nr:repeat protein [Schlesneria sp.]